MTAPPSASKIPVAKVVVAKAARVTGRARLAAIPTTPKANTRAHPRTVRIPRSGSCAVPKAVTHPPKEAAETSARASTPRTPLTALKEANPVESAVDLRPPSAALVGRAIGTARLAAIGRAPAQTARVLWARKGRTAGATQVPSGARRSTGAFAARGAFLDVTRSGAYVLSTQILGDATRAAKARAELQVISVLPGADARWLITGPP